MISQGLALAVLAWLQTLPEFAVEAVIAWEAGKDPSITHLAIANFTGAIRLLLGLGWPMIYFVAAFSAMRSHRNRVWAEIQLDDEHAIEVVALTPPLAYFFWVWYKGSLSIVDAGILSVFYILYLVLLWRQKFYGEVTFKFREGVVVGHVHEHRDHLVSALPQADLGHHDRGETGVG